MNFGDSRRAAAMRNAQAAHDNATPDDCEISDEYLDRAAEELGDGADNGLVVARARSLMTADARRAADDLAADRYELFVEPTV